MVDIGGKGLFMKEIDDVLLNGDIDIVVYFMKDVFIYFLEGMIFFCNFFCEDVCDVFICLNYFLLVELFEGSVVGSVFLWR